MGIHDRDYYRDSTRGMFDGWGKSRATVWLIAITCGVFFGQLVDGVPPWASDLVKAGALDAQKILAGEVWRVVTSAFLHVSLFHLFFNMVVLYWAGSHFEDLYSSAEMVAFYLGATVFTSVVFVLLQLAAPAAAPPPGIGASISVMAVFVVFAFHYPHQRILLFFVIPMPAWLLCVAYIVVDMSGAVGALGNTGIGHLAHLGGAVFGLLYYQRGWRLTSVFKRSPNRAKRRAPALRLVPVEPQDVAEPRAAGVDAPPRPAPAQAQASDEPIEAKVDRVLAKVSALGQESLTEEEREILFRAGEVYKKRRK
jgi:membrane associated rhomboid family serine protease